MYDVLLGIALTATIYNSIVLYKLCNEYKDYLKSKTNLQSLNSATAVERLTTVRHQDSAPTPVVGKLTVPVLDPQMISKNIANPPKPKGGFGTSVDGV